MSLVEKSHLSEEERILNEGVLKAPLFVENVFALTQAAFEAHVNGIITAEDLIELWWKQIEGLRTYLRQNYSLVKQLGVHSSEAHYSYRSGVLKAEARGHISIFFTDPANATTFEFSNGDVIVADDPNPAREGIVQISTSNYYSGKYTDIYNEASFGSQDPLSIKLRQGLRQRRSRWGYRTTDKVVNIYTPFLTG